MTNHFEIVTDSCCNLLESVIEEQGFHILPLTFMADGEETVYQSYLKGAHIDLSSFYKKMREGKVFKTSLPNLADTEELLRSLLEQERDILYLGFSSGLSGTYESTSLLMNQLREEFPHRKLIAVDTLSASGGEGLMVLQAARLRTEGNAIEDVARWVEDNKLKVAHWFTVDDLVYLFRGGRVSRTSAWAGSLLNIKPILHVDNEGHLIPLEKCRGRKKSLNTLYTRMQESVSEPTADQIVLINHGDCLEDAQYLADMIREGLGIENITINYIDPVIGAHSGPGTIALFFMSEGR